MSYPVRCALADHPRTGSLPDQSTPGFAWFLRVKAFTDVAIASIMLLATLPVLLVLLALVKLTSPGPAIYRQIRLGRDGRAFALFKIRTMRQDCERQSGPRWATTNDARATPLGRLLRRSHLDELPQLWNVLRGEMSLVGPRPERPEFVERLERVVPGYRGRMAVLPGITGLAQVQLPPDSTVDDVHRKVACDLCYIREMGPALDLKILAGTTFKVLGVPFEVTSQVLNLPGRREPVRPEAGGRPADAPISHFQSA